MYPPCIPLYALVQATVGVGTVLIVYIGVAYTRGVGVSPMGYCVCQEALQQACLNQSDRGLGGGTGGIGRLLQGVQHVKCINCS